MTTPDISDRHDPRLPAHRPPPRAQEGRRGVLGRHDHGRRAGGDRRRTARRHARAPRGAGPRQARTRRFPRPSPTTTRCSTPRSRWARSRPASRRWSKADGAVDLAGYFTIARGEGDNVPAEMTKWFDSNYHYLVPEIGPETTFSLASDRLVREVAEATASGFRTRRCIVGPVTFLLLSKPSEGAPEGYSPLDRLDDLLPVYAELLAALFAAGAEWVQLDEPGLVSESIDVPRATRARRHEEGVRPARRGAGPPADLRRRAVRQPRRRPARARRHPGRGDRPRPGARRRSDLVHRPTRCSSAASSTATTSGAATSPRRGRSSNRSRRSARTSPSRHPRACSTRRTTSRTSPRSTRA